MWFEFIFSDLTKVQIECLCVFVSYSMATATLNYVFIFLHSRPWCKTIFSPVLITAGFFFSPSQIWINFVEKREENPSLCLNGGGLIWTPFFQPSCKLWALLASPLTEKNWNWKFPHLKPVFEQQLKHTGRVITLLRKHFSNTSVWQHGKEKQPKGYVFALLTL